MKVRLRGKGFLREFIAEKEIKLEPGTTLKQLPAILNIPEQCQLIYIVNETVKKPGSEISDGDNIIIVSALFGG